MFSVKSPGMRTEQGLLGEAMQPWAAVRVEVAINETKTDAPKLTARAGLRHWNCELRNRNARANGVVCVVMARKHRNERFVDEFRRDARLGSWDKRHGVQGREVYLSASIFIAR